MVYTLGTTVKHIGGTMIYMPAEDGQGLVEYALIIMLIALVLIAVITLFGEELSSTYSTIQSSVGDLI